MKRLGKLARLPLRTILALACKGKIAIPADSFCWLGISVQSVTDELLRRRLQAISYDHVTTGEKNGHKVLHSCTAPLLDAVAYAVAVEGECLPRESMASHSELYQKWQTRLAGQADRMRAFFCHKRPLAVVIVQGYESTNAAARWAAIDLGIPLLAVENTALSTRMLWENVSGITTNRNLSHNFFWRYQDVVSDAEADDYCEQLIRDTKRLKQGEHQSPTASLKRTQRPMMLFFGQVYTDSSVVFGLRDWTSPLQVIQQCAQWCAANDYDLVVKLHPKESSGGDPVVNRKYQKLTWRKIQQHDDLSQLLTQINATVDCDNVYDTYSLVEQCTVAVTVNSQGGLEAAIRGKPVVLCGDAFYGGLGFTHDSPHPAMLDAAILNAVSSRPGTAARKFTYIYFEKYCRPKTPAALAELIVEQCR